MSNRTTSWNAYQEPMSPGIDDTTTSITVADASNLVAPYGYLVLDPDNPSLREYVRVTNVVGNVLTVQRGLDGSAGAGASAHSDNAPVRAVAVGQWLDDIFSDIEDLEAADATFVEKAGDTMTGDLGMSGGLVTGLSLTPVLSGDAAAKGYVDAQDGLYLPLTAGATKPLTDVLFIDAGTTQRARYSISQVRLGDDTDGGGAGRFSFINLGAGGGFDYDAQIIASNPGASEGRGDLQFRSGLAQFVVGDASTAVVEVDGKIRTRAGSAATGSQAYGFTAWPEIGMYGLDAATLGFSAGANARRFSIGDTAVIVGNVISPGGPSMATIPTQTTPAYAFWDDVGTGMYRVAASQVAWAINGNRRLYLDSDVLLLGNGSAPNAGMLHAFPSVGKMAYGFQDDPATGIRRIAAGNMAFYSADTLVMNLTADKVALGINSLAAAMHLGPSDAAPTYSFVGDTNSGLTNAGNGDVRLVLNGVWDVRLTTNLTQMRSVYNAPSVATANVAIAAGSFQVFRATTSLRSAKTDIKTLNDDDFDSLHPVSYRSVLELDDNERLRYGFVADEIPVAAEEHESYDPRALLAITVAALKKVKERVAALEAV